MTLAIRNVTFMTADPTRLAAFWMAATGYTERRQEGAEILVAPADWSFPRLTFQKIDAPRPTPTSQHLDMTADDMEAEVARLVALGAAYVRRVDEAAGGPVWTVLRDPDGNEFCVVQRPDGE